MQRFCPAASRPACAPADIPASVLARLTAPVPHSVFAGPPLVINMGILNTHPIAFLTVASMLCRA